jgi:hypothetical protein
MKRWWFGPRNKDEEKITAIAKAKRDFTLLLEREDESGFVRYVKELRPTITKDELLDAIETFREQCQTKHDR